MTYRHFFRLAVLLIMAALAMVAVQAASPLTLTVVYDNYPHQPGLTTDWGFACLVEGLDQTILFDTGMQEDVLLHNLDQLGIDSARVQQVVLSHAHLDHTGGLAAFLARQPKVRVAVPVSFPDSIRSIIRTAGAKILPVQGPAPICPGAFTTGEVAGPFTEQALVLETPPGLVVITGCAHPGIVRMLEVVKAQYDRPIYMVLGGFHLVTAPADEIAAIVQRFRALGVRKVGATHCTGDTAIAAFRRVYGDDYVPMGVGRVITVNH